MAIMMKLPETGKANRVAQARKPRPLNHLTPGRENAKKIKDD